MIEFISLTNYRNVLNKTKFELKPITILIGPNNSGKSSLIKSLLLLKENAKDFENLTFQKGSHRLGNFDTVISKGNHANLIEFELPTHLLGPATLRLRYEGRKNKINNGRLKELCIYKQNSLEVYLNVTNIEYNADSNYLTFFQWEINYSAFYFAFESDRDLRESEFGRKMFGFQHPDKIDLTDPHKIIFNCKKPIFDFIQESMLSDNSNSKIEERNATIQFLNLLSVKDHEQTHPEDATPSIIETIIRKIKEDYRGESGRSSSYFNIFKNKFELLKINPTANGKAFFEEISNDITRSLDSLNYDLNKLTYLSSTAARQDRLYTDKDNSYFQNILTRYDEESKWGNEDFLTKWMLKFELITETEVIDINRIAQSGFELLIKNFETNKEINLADCGFGVTQILTLLIEFAIANNTQYLLEEPEANLHPALQSKMADLFCELCGRKNFIIETHSEYMLRKFQYLVAKGELSSNDIIIHYFWKEDDVSKCKQINILPTGELSESFENGFYDEADKIALDLFLLKNHQKN